MSDAFLVERIVRAVLGQLGTAEEPPCACHAAAAGCCPDRMGRLVGQGAARFGLQASRSARSLAEGWFKGERARALVAGLAAHSILPLEKAFSAAVTLILGAAAHAAGWPVARGGSHPIQATRDGCSPEGISVGRNGFFQGTIQPGVPAAPGRIECQPLQVIGRHVEQRKERR